MAVTGVQETYESRSLSGALRESLKYERSFVVEVDSLTTPLLEIAKAPGVRLGHFHPECNYCICQSYSVSHRGGAALMYNVKFSYDIFKDDPTEPDDDPKYEQIPAPVWSGGSSVTTVPTFVDRAGKRITNSAGTVIPDLERDQAETTLSLVRCYPGTAMATVLQALANLTNTINNAAWSGGAAKTWKCQGGRWQRKIEGDDEGARLVYFEVTWDFLYRGETWTIKPLDVGFEQKVYFSGPTGEWLPSKTGTKRMAINGEDGKPVREPAPLDDGIQYTGVIDGVTWPKVLSFDAYVERDFAASFGSPS